MEKTLTVLNELEKQGIVRKYAIGGGIAAMFYMESTTTFDLDVFVFLPESHSEIMNITPIYEYLRQRGYEPKHEHVEIATVPVQFLPAYNSLIQEAINEAAERDFGKIKTRVFRPEHLCAIMLQTGRAKDRERMAQMLEVVDLDRVYLDAILRRHGLYNKWEEFSR